MPAIVAAIVAATAAGVWAERRFGSRGDAFSRRSLLWVLYLVLPPITFLNLVGADLDLDAALGIVLGQLAVTVLGIAAWFVAARVPRLPRATVGAVICAVIVVNTGYLGYAVIAALVGFDRLGEAVAYDILVSGPALLIGAFAVGAIFGTRAGEGPRERTVAFFTRNPALAAVAAVLAPEALAPEALVDLSRVVMLAILPLGFFAAGVALAGGAEQGSFAFSPPLDRGVATAVALRLAGGPLLLLALSAPRIELPDTYLLLAAMPCGLNTMIVAHAYGLDLRTAAGTIAWSTALAVVGLSVLAAVA